MKTQYHNLSNEELESIIKENEAYINKLWNDAKLEWQDYCTEVKKTNVNEMYAERLLRKEPTYRKADEFDLDYRITIEEFIDWCKYSFIYHKWYVEDPLVGYNLTNDYTNMLMYGYGDLFNRDNGTGVIPTYQAISFYCINKNGYLKMCRLNTNYIPAWSINDMMKSIKELCIKNDLKFLSLWSKYYNYLWVEEFLDEDLKYEYNKEGDVILYV